MRLDAKAGEVDRWGGRLGGGRMGREMGGWGERSTDGTQLG